MGRSPTRCRLWSPSAGGVAALGFLIAQAIQPVSLEDQLEAGAAWSQVRGPGGPAAWPSTPVAHFQPQFHDRIATWEQTGSRLGAYPKLDRDCGPARGQTPSRFRPGFPDRGSDLTWATPLAHSTPFWEPGAAPGPPAVPVCAGRAGRTLGWTRPRNEAWRLRRQPARPLTRPSWLLDGFLRCCSGGILHPQSYRTHPPCLARNRDSWRPGRP
jgi:hypothetical protein